jgi:hypothetical protein
MSVGPANAADSLEEVQQAAQDYLSSQTTTRVGDYETYSDNPYALTASELYDHVALGIGEDALTRRFKTVCWNPETIEQRSLLVRSGSSSMDVVETESEFKSFLEREASASGSYGGLFSGQGSVKVSRSSSFSTKHKTVVAKYDYIMGERWLVAPYPTLHDRYQTMLSNGQYEQFVDECGDVYLKGVWEGASLTDKPDYAHRLRDQGIP